MFALPFLSSIGSKAAAAAIAALLVFSFGFYAGHRWESSALNAWKAAQSEQAARDNAKALAELQAHDAAAASQLAAMIEVVRERSAQVAQLRKAINAAPKTRACVDSPAIRALFDGLRGAGSAQRN